MKNISIIILLNLISFACSFNEPVNKEYFNDINKINGGLPPSPPPSLTVSSCIAGATIQFTPSFDPEGQDLFYLVYATRTNPSNFIETEFYNPLYYYGYITGTTQFLIDESGTYYLWMTSYDGGRESYHSNVLLIPNNCP